MQTVILKSGREKTLRRHHPWLFSGAFKDADTHIEIGATVKIVTAKGEIMALGAYSPHSQIRVRIWTYDPSEAVDTHFFYQRLKRAIDMRAFLISDNDTACRLVNAESDGLPGVIVDRYGDYLVCQFLSAGAEFNKQDIVGQLRELLSPKGIYERSDVEVRQKEGLTPQAGLLAGEEPPDLIQIRQGDLQFWVDVRQGHKTGMYLDQRENRYVVRQFADGAEVLNCFAYTGGFALAALQGGAVKVTNIESSAEALALADKNTELNGFDKSKIENVRGDVFDILRKYRDTRREFDMVILDPPKFVNSAQQLQRGCRGYKDINLLAIKLLKQNGILVTFSCSGHLSPELFQKIVADAALDAGRESRIVQFLGQSSDHPVALNFPEGRYLKGLICHVC
ncbi:MAG: rRNA (cytosine1962-C5)-methyltransferase [Gammaproteobacteria bacterium]|nr:rRNA (cytosine1962-C5)-methyltransferase [Gammaproteobacteria bacterium]